jgi:hypothetical protein
MPAERCAIQIGLDIVKDIHLSQVLDNGLRFFLIADEAPPNRIFRVIETLL